MERDGNETHLGGRGRSEHVALLTAAADAAASGGGGGDFVVGRSCKEGCQAGGGLARGVGHPSQAVTRMQRLEKHFIKVRHVFLVELHKHTVRSRYKIQYKTGKNNELKTFRVCYNGKN